MSSSIVSSSLFLLALVASMANSLPVQATFKILSLHSARFVSSTANGDVHAKAGDASDPSTTFYQHTMEFPRVSYESAQYPGKFLVLDSTNGQLRVEEPTDEGNEVFMRIAHPTSYGLFALKSDVSHDCYVAFDHYGDVSSDPHICDGDALHSGHGFHTAVHIIDMF